MASLRILVADDHEIARRVIIALLAFHPGWEICGEASDGREALEKVAQLRPDIVLLDIDMPIMNGLEATRQIVQTHPVQKIIILTMSDSEQIVRDVFHAGALGFVLKSNATHDLTSAIEAVQRGQTFFTARFAELILKGYLKDDQGKESDEAPLTERERETVQLLTKELTITVGHQWGKPNTARRAAKHLAIAMIMIAATAAGWFAYGGQMEQARSLMDKSLVSLRLKKPPPPIYNGNPDTRVWIDLHTALYYCPGADAYGKTRQGKFARQRNAQLDHFESASRKACD
jgi:DNA-binding NarL/FixJ family response regulator